MPAGMSPYDLCTQPYLPFRTSGPVGSTTELHYVRLPPEPIQDDKPSSWAPIIFLHGMETCHLEWTRVTPFLKEYDRILVDLPGHTGSKNVPHTLDAACKGLAHLIRTQVIPRGSGKAHIVGLSQGGYIALEFARRCPELVLDVFCTGCAPNTGLRGWLISKPRLFAGIIRVIGSLPTESVFWWSLGLEPLPGFRPEIRKNSSFSLLTAGFVACNQVTLEKIAEIKDVRIAIVAGGKLDSVEDATEAGKVLKRNNEACAAFVVRDAIHLWDLQLPELFAKGVRAWVEKSEMPKEFEVLV